MRIGEAAERRIQMEQLYDVLKFLVLPTECYHSGMEKKFEWKESAKEDCEHYCSKCRGEVPKFTEESAQGGIVLLADTEGTGD